MLPVLDTGSAVMDLPVKPRTLRAAGWGLAALLLAAPWLAMQVTDEVAWSPWDFALFAAMLGGAGLMLELAVMRSRHMAYRAGAVLAVGAAFLMIWASLAVGIVGNEGDQINLAYPGVVALALATAAAWRFRAAGLAKAMLVAAATLAAIAVFALSTGPGGSPGALAEILVANGVFAALFAGAAVLFSLAARRGG
ncbi:hypothetical protein [Caulobacter zeae]|nr:hypothetical protein [Caulobacter zeae]